MPSDVSRLRKNLSHYKKACETILEDFFKPQDIFVSFDHSLLHPWLANGIKRSIYDVTGSRLFELYQKYGHLTPYTLTLGSASYVEILDQLDHKKRSLENLIEGRGIRRLFRLMTSERAFSELETIKKQIDYGAINRDNFDQFLDLLESKKILGSGNAIPVDLRAENLTVELLNQQIGILKESKNYTQKDEDDRDLHIQLDAMHLLGVTGINIAYNSTDKIMVYCGERAMQYSFAQNSTSHSRDPLCVLISCFSFSQSTSHISAIPEAKSFIDNFRNGMEHAVAVLDKYKGQKMCISEMYKDDQRLIQAIQEQYIKKIYFKQVPDFIDNTAEDDTILESLSDAVLKAAGEYDNVSHTAGNLAKLIEQSTDVRLFGEIETEIISDGAKRRMDAIMKGLSLKT